MAPNRGIGARLSPSRNLYDKLSVDVIGERNSDGFANCVIIGYTLALWQVPN